MIGAQTLPSGGSPTVSPEREKNETHVPVTVNRFRNASVAWLNRRWFAQVGLDVSDQAVVERLSSELLKQFAYGVPTPDAVAHLDLNDVRVFWADRYGGTGLESHGGSGRAAACNGVQVKGVGPTPLIGAVRDWAYSHGCVWLEEAVREAIFGEVVDAEFPHGATPVIAIVDCGYRAVHLDGSPGERRALILRPEKLRLAHLQRAALFKEGSDREAFLDQFDVNRVVAHFQTLRHQGVGQNVAASLKTALAKVIDQALFSRVSRIFTGGPYSSSFGVSGALIDFGSFTSVADWSSVASNLNAPTLGMERRILVGISRSLGFYARKYSECPSALKLESTLPEDMAAHFDRAELTSFDALFGFDAIEDADISREIFSVLFAYFSYQQKNQINHSLGMRSGMAWLADDLRQLAFEPNAKVVEVALRIQKVLRGSDSRMPPLKTALLCHAARHLLPRLKLDRAALQESINAMLSEADELNATSVGKINMFITETISASRRFWPGLPRNLIVKDQKFDGVTACLACLDSLTGRSVFALLVQHQADGVTVFDRYFPAPFEIHAPETAAVGSPTWIVVESDNAGQKPLINYALENGPSAFRYFSDADAIRLGQALNEKL